MTKQEIKETIARVLGANARRINVGTTETRVNGSLDVGYDQLKELTEALGTTKINFVFTEGDPGYSSWTPGSPDHFEFTIGIGATS